MHFSFTFTALTTLASLAAFAAADSSSTTTVSVFAAGTSQMPITDVAASIVGVDATATTYALTCVSSVESCDYTTPVTFIDGPSTFGISYVASTESEGLAVTLTVSQDCKITGTTSAAVCSISEGAEASYNGESSSTHTTTVTSLSGSLIYYDALTVTAGVDKLASATASTASGNAAAPRITQFVGGAAAAAVGVAAMAIL